MASVQERLQLKREPLDKWSVREQLCLASAVARSGDQNWMSVSRSLKPFGDPNRPPDWFHQKNCAAQYGTLLGNVEMPKRKKRSSIVEIGIDTPAENILRKLLAERQMELTKLLSEEKQEYQKLQEDMVLLQSGKVSEEQLDKWCREIDEEEYRKEQEAVVHAQWLKEREIRKQEIEKAWRPVKSYSAPGQKRKSSDSIDNFIENGQEDAQQIQHPQPQLVPVQSQESVKPALSPLLTSLLKSPSQVQNVATTSSILHTAITNQRPVSSANTNPTIASLLNSSTGVTVSPGLQQLVSTAIGQESSNATLDENQPLGTDILDDPNLPNLKIDDLTNSILVQDGPLPEIKKEEVDDIISEIIENAQDIVADPEQHLQLDGNGDININLELDDLEEEEAEIPDPPKDSVTETCKSPEKSCPPPEVDPFEFQEDPVIFEPAVKPGISLTIKDSSKQFVPHYQQQQTSIHQDEGKKLIWKECESNNSPNVEIKNEANGDSKSQKSMVPGSVEIVEVVVMDDDESDKEFNRTQIEDIVYSSKLEESVDLELSKFPNIDEEKVKIELEEGGTPDSQENLTFKDSSEVSDNILDAKKNININLEEQENQADMTLNQDFTEELYDNLNMEVKIDKSGKAKRDYSRTKKKEEKGFDMLLAIEKAAQLEESDFFEEMLSDNNIDNEKKDTKAKSKSDNDRSNSPWTEEEDIGNSRGNRRRYSTPATPVDSLPNSPASSVAYNDEDRDHRNWKKSVMLVYNRLASNRYASLFLKPITEDQAPGYGSIVYRPMDLQTIKKNIESGSIRTTLEFKRDVMLMFTNAIMYNKTDDTIYDMARQMQQECIHPINILMQAQGQVNAPLRRETRTSESSCKRKRPNNEESLKNKKRKED